MQIVDRLLETPCYMIDFLPQQVPKNCAGQYFKVENYFLNHYDRYGVEELENYKFLSAECFVYPQFKIYNFEI